MITQTDPQDVASMTEAHSSAMAAKEKLPLSGLLALAAAGFITILTEALPAGLLPQIAISLRGSEAVMGQLITVYAIGSLLAAIPLVAATQSIRRRPLFLATIFGFAVVNAVTAVSDNLVLTLVARFFAGVFAGLAWALIAGYATRMVSSRLRGRAIAIALAGTPLALTVGIPAGTFVGNQVGWRVTFGLLSLLTLFLMGWILAKVPDFPGERAEQRHRLRDVFSLPGFRPVMAVTLLFILTHNVLYTYISPLLSLAHLSARTDTVLLVFGVTALGGIWVVGALVDRWLRELVLLSTAMFAVSGWILAVFPSSPVAIYVAVSVWGLAFGGAATLFQTGASNAAGRAQDIAQSMMVTVWNVAIAGGGIVGGLLLGKFGAHSFSYVVVALMLAALLITWLTRSFRRGPAA
jgi:predicted MFS family arabinose efflux permease